MSNEKIQLDKKKQLIIFINPEPNVDMGDRLSLFIQHVIARGQFIEAENYAFMLTREINKIGIRISDVTQERLAKSPQFTEKMIELQKMGLLKSLTDLDKNSIDQIVIIGAGIPSKNKNTYSSLNGLSRLYFPYLIKSIQNIIDSNLKENGLVRVQICHSGSKMITTDDDEKIFSEAIKPKGKETIKVIAPSYYSIISGRDGRVVDLQINGLNNFKMFASSGKKYLNCNYKDSTVISFFNNYIKQNTKTLSSTLNEVCIVYPDGTQQIIAKQKENFY